MLQQLTGRAVWLYAVIIVCALPLLLHLLGLDFSSRGILLTPAKFSDGLAEADGLFYVAKGAMHHVLLEWSAVSIAVIAAIASMLHYSGRRDVTVPIIGMALLCAGLVDAFHALAATRVIEANTPNMDFIPFTWMLSRTFNAGIMIMGAGISLWIRRPSVGKGDLRLRGQSMLIAIGMLFAALASSLANAIDCKRRFRSWKNWSSKIFLHRGLANWLIRRAIPMHLITRLFS